MLTLRVLQPSRSAMLSAVAAGSVSGHECRARFRAGRTNLIGGAEPSTRWNSALSLCTNAKRYRLRAGSDLYGGEPVILRSMRSSDASPKISVSLLRRF
jgi:hypothetical protein